MIQGHRLLRREKCRHRSALPLLPRRASSRRALQNAEYVQQLLCHNGRARNLPRPSLPGGGLWYRAQQAGLKASATGKREERSRMARQA